MKLATSVALSLAMGLAAATPMSANNLPTQYSDDHTNFVQTNYLTNTSSFGPTEVTSENSPSIKSDDLTTVAEAPSRQKYFRSCHDGCRDPFERAWPPQGHSYVQVPEPAALPLLGIGFMGFLLACRRRLLP